MLLFAVPLAIAVIVAAVIYVPRLLANPKYDFIYVDCDGYSCRDAFQVNDGRIVKNDSDPEFYDAMKLRYYDVSDGSSRELTTAEARNYRIINSSKSPDGYSIARESASGGFLFWSNSSEGWYLKNGAATKKVELSYSGSYYSSDIKFLGWVEQ